MILPIAAQIAVVASGAGATLPFVTYEAEDAASNGVLIGPDRRFGTLVSEASGRRAVRLDRAGQTVSFTLREPANALTLRYSIPDGRNGRGQDVELAIEVDGNPVDRLSLTSRFGWFYGRYPFTNRPAAGRAHHFFDEARWRIGRTMAAGSKVTLRWPTGQRTAWIALDCVDFEAVPPAGTRPPKSIPVTRLGADPTGRRNSAAAFRAGIRAARFARRPLWIPPGKYRVNDHLVVDDVRIIGAGPWYSILTGRGVGVFGRKAPRGSRDVELSGFAVEGEVADRNDHLPLSAIGGAFNRSLISNLYLHHTKVGVWLDGPMHDLIVRRLRIADQTADGINLHRGVRRATIEQNFIRNTGDDGIALWSDRQADANIIIRHNTVVAPILANGIAIYGGRNITVSNNLVADTLTQGGGIHLGARFHSTPFSGAIMIDRNHLVRTGSFDPNWHFGVGAIWIYALEQPVRDARIMLRNNHIDDSSCEAVQLLGPKPIGNVAIDRLEVIGGGDTVLALQSAGSLKVRDVRVTNGSDRAVMVPENFDFEDRSGNSGWSWVRAETAGLPTCGSIEPRR